MKKWWLFLILAIALAGCKTARTGDAEDKTAHSEKTPLLLEVKSSATPFPVQNTPSLNERRTITPGAGQGGLTIVEIPILGRETLDRVFETFGYEPWVDPLTFASELEIGGDRISYRVDEEIGAYGELSREEIAIFRNEQLVQTIEAGRGGPISVVWAFEAFEGSWFLEINRYEQPEEGLDDDTVRGMQIQGDIFQDGVSLNEREGYQESFGLHQFKGKAFYFFRRDDAYGYFYNGEEYPLGYATIAHHQCCSGAQMNPRFFEDEMVIFASKEDQQYLVKIVSDNE